MPSPKSWLPVTSGASGRWQDECWLGGIEAKRSLAPEVEKGFHFECADLEPHRACVVYPGKERFSLSADIQAMGLDEAIAGLRGKQ
jgi:hypothetical protein